MDKPRIYIDMDHTFCDFNGSLDYWYQRALTETERKYPWSMKGYFESLLPMKGALEFWKKWEKDADLWFLTRPSIKNRLCYTEKAEWVYKYLGELGVEKLILSPRKELLIGDVLIDDDHKAGQPLFNGEWWKFGSDDCKDWDHADKLMDKFKY